MRLLAALSAALFVLPSLGWAQTQNTNVGALQAQDNLSELSSPPFARMNLNMPKLVNIRDYGGYADAIKGAAHYAATGTNVALGAVQFISVNVTSTSGASTATLTSGMPLPNISAFLSGFYLVNIPGAGVAGATVHGALTALNTSTGAITCTSCAFGANTNAPFMLELSQNGYPRNLSLTGNFYGNVAITPATDALSGAVYGSTISISQDMIPNQNGDTAADGLHICVATQGQSEWCGVVNGDTAADGETLTVVGTGASPAAIPYTQGSSAVTTAASSASTTLNAPTAGLVVGESAFGAGISATNPSPTIQTITDSGHLVLSSAVTVASGATVYFSAAPSRVTWGRFLFRPDDATACGSSGRNIEIPQAGTGTNSYGGQINPFEGKIASRYDALSATLTGGVGTSVGYLVGGAFGIGVEGLLTTGCDDYPAYQKAMNATYHTPSTIDQAVALYFPSNSFMASATTGNHPVDIALQCGVGTVFWPSLNQPFYHGAAACGTTREIKSFPDAKDVIPQAELKHLSTLAAGSTATLVLAGNSPGEPGANGAQFISSRLERICSAFQGAYPDLNWNCVDRSFGGSQMWSLDPNGMSNGIPIGSASPAWYTNPAATWMSFVESANPDVLIIGFSDQEAQSLQISAMLDIQALTQSAAWATATGSNPDIGYIPWPWQPTSFASQVGTNMAASFQRSFVKACVTKLANGGCPFLIDESRMESILVDGYDPETTPMRLATALPTNGTKITTFPWSYQVPRTGLSGPMSFIWTNASATSGSAIGNMFAAAGGEFDFTISGNSNATPQSVTKSFLTTGSSASGQATVALGVETYGPNAAYTINPGDAVSGQTGLPTNAIVQSTNPTAGTITLNNPLTATIPISRTLVFTPPGPNTGYPGGLLRVSKDAGSGDMAYRYDTVYFQVAHADCSGTAGNSFATCTTAEVGNWHQGMQIAFPGGGTSQCPNPGGAANCYIATIGSVSFAVSSAGITSETINLYNGATAATAASRTAGSVPATFSNVQPYVFRTSVPLKVTTRPAETFGASAYNACQIISGVSVTPFIQVEYRGSRALLDYCDTLGPGYSWLMDQYVERFDSPFLFTIDSPNHMAANTGFIFSGPGITSAVDGTGWAAGGGWRDVELEYPTAAAKARLVPDIYGWCAAGIYPTGDVGYAPYGGQCAGHYGHMGANLIDDAILSQLRLR